MLSSSLGFLGPGFDTLSPSLFSAGGLNQAAISWSRDDSQVLACSKSIHGTVICVSEKTPKGGLDLQWKRGGF